MRFDELGNTIEILCNKYGKYQKKIFLLGVFFVAIGLLARLSIFVAKDPYTIKAGFGIHTMNYHKKDKIYCYGKMIQVLNVYDSSKNTRALKKYRFSLDDSKYIVLSMKFKNYNKEMWEFQIPIDFSVSDGKTEIPFGYGDVQFLPDNLELIYKESRKGFISATVSMDFKPKYVYFNCYGFSTEKHKIRISL